MRNVLENISLEFGRYKVNGGKKKILKKPYEQPEIIVKGFGFGPVMSDGKGTPITYSSTAENATVDPKDPDIWGDDA